MQWKKMTITGLEEANVTYGSLLATLEGDPQPRSAGTDLGHGGAGSAGTDLGHAGAGSAGTDPGHGGADGTSGELRIFADASEDALGAVLVQEGRVVASTTRRGNARARAGASGRAEELAGAAPSAPPPQGCCGCGRPCNYQCTHCRRCTICPNCMTLGEEGRTSLPWAPRQTLA